MGSIEELNAYCMLILNIASTMQGREVIVFVNADLYAKVVASL